MIRHPARRRLRPVVAIAAFLLLATPQRAVAAEPEALSIWTYSLYKTITYELFANLADIPLYQLMIGGAVGGVGLFTAVNVTTAAAAYYVHEVLWNLYGPPMQETPETAFDVGLEKVIVYRVVSTARNLALVYAFTGGVFPTVTFALVSNIVDATLYAANEYAWYAYGPPLESIRFDTAAFPDTDPRPLPADAPGIDLRRAALVMTNAAAEVRRGAVYLKGAAATATDGIAARVGRVRSWLQ